MKVYRHLAQILTLIDAHRKDGRKLTSADLSIIQDGAIVFDDQQILWVGADRDLPTEYSAVSAHDLSGHVLTPALCDSHTHLLFAGDRAKEYVERLNGVDYQLIASRGGGILYTMSETLKSTEEELFRIGFERLERLESYGVRTVEMKSGYALTQEGELRLLRVAQRLKNAFRTRVRVISTYMGAHAVPSSFTSSAEFIRSVVIPTLEVAHREKLVDAVDIFHEQGYFSTADVELLFKTAQRLGLACKMHADEFQDNGGAKLACSHQALSADHLLKVGDEGIQFLSTSKTIATLLPGTAFFLGKPLPPARRLLDAGCKVAIASDYNPGSSHVDNLLLVASLSAPSLKMNLAEIWAAITLNSSAALGLTDQGVLIPGKRPQFALFKALTAAQITYNWGLNLSITPP